MKFFINLFRNYPCCTGLLCLVLLSHLTEPKDLQTPILSMPSNFLPVFFFYVFSMLGYMLFILPNISSERREKITWLWVSVNIVVLTIFMLLTSLQ